MRTTLCIGDSHVEANEDLRRFDVLGELIADKQPDTIINMGDFLSLDSLSAWDMNKRAKMEGRRFAEELESGREAVSKMMGPVAHLRREQRNRKKKVYNPKMITLLGNHEDRWYRYLDTHPELIDVVDIFKAVGFEHYGWESIAYREYAYVNGVAFTHIPMNGINQPISGQSIMNTAARTHDQSVVFGHTHRFAVSSDTRHGEQAQQIIALNVGCYFEGVPDYAKGSSASKDWWRGVVMLDHYEEGLFDIRAYRMENLFREYT